MEKQKRWQLVLILTVLLLTLYNILPTVFYYSKPLRAPITQERAEAVSSEIVSRVNQLEEDSIDWLHSFSKLIHVKPKAIEQQKDDPRLIAVSFSSVEEADRFRKMLPQAGKRIPFFPAQLELFEGAVTEPSKVMVMRQVGNLGDSSQTKDLFTFIPKYKEDGQQLDTNYKALVADRVETLASQLGGKSLTLQQFEALQSLPAGVEQDDYTLLVADEVNKLDKTTAKFPALSKRVWSNMAQGAENDAPLTATVLARFEATKTRLVAKKEELKGGKNSELLAQVERNIASLDKASQTLKKKETDLKGVKPVLDVKAVTKALLNGEAKEGQELVSLKGSNPYVESLLVDFAGDKIFFNFYSDIDAIRSKITTTEDANFQKDQLNQLIYNEIATVSRISDENILPYEDGFALSLSNLQGTESFLTLNLGAVAAKESQSLLSQLANNWTPQHPDLTKEAYPLREWSQYEKEDATAKKLGLVVYSPSMSLSEMPKGFNKGSLYVIARGLSSIIEKDQASTNKALKDTFQGDFGKLHTLLSENGFNAYSGKNTAMDKAFSKDVIFEQKDYYNNLINATRENFEVKGSKNVAVLPFTDVEQRILARNKIDDQIQENLLKWKDEYSAAQVKLDHSLRYTIPEPTESPFWANLKLNAKKYFRGDDRKIIKWGLDLSGGKSVRIGLKDSNGRAVTNPEDVKQAVNELYTRINKLGVSERTIRVENNNIVLEFPGSQAMSASELVQASKMTFNLVNEKFGMSSPANKVAAAQFLQSVWNEARVTNKKSADEINEIAWQHLGGSATSSMGTHPVSEAAKTLIDNGLVLANPYQKNASRTFDDQISKVAIFRSENPAQWPNPNFPLLFVFNNWALEGSNLTDVGVGFSQQEGNNLSFSVKKSYEGQNAPTGSPRDDFYTWTSQFAQDKIAGTPKELYTENGRGWRMAVILNDSVISAPGLNSALKDGGNIYGGFSQREVESLAADLKAGSLSFTPRILSEQNISPELGTEERYKGIFASAIALVLVAAVMIGYYKFAGVVATIAVFLNIFIMWGVLQNLDAALTLPGIAGIVLTIGMAVDANVLVFERIREEFALTGRIASAIQAGYRKAFTAIFDSNITTIMAALILIQFDSGPIKGFAVTLIIGIFSSMFTALFLTRYFFAGWVKNPENKELKMSHWINNTKFDFLGKAKIAIVTSLVVMALGAGLLFKERNTILGMDFTGGYSLMVEVEPKPETESYRLLALDALHQSGASNTDVEVRQLTLPNQLKISLGQGMDQPDHPFYNMPIEIKDSGLAYSFQKNPRIDWVVKSLQTHGLIISDTQLQTLDSNWSVVSGQFSDAMRNNALLGLGMALLSILIYITFRFEFIYAVAAVVALAHDVLITMGILAFFHWMGFQVQIDLQVIGAIMTIIGYSLNDTIIVFDRIREDLKVLRKLSFYDAVNHALNVTLSRTLMTSGTTLVVLFALVLLGGSSIFAFSLIMTIGVLVGTISSLFIAAPVLLWLHNREVSMSKLSHQS